MEVKGNMAELTALVNPGLGGHRRTMAHGLQLGTAGFSEALDFLETRNSQSLGKGSGHISLGNNELKHF